MEYEIDTNIQAYNILHKGDIKGDIKGYIKGYIKLTQCIFLYIFQKKIKNIYIIQSSENGMFYLLRSSGK